MLYVIVVIKVMFKFLYNFWNFCWSKDGKYKNLWLTAPKGATPVNWTSATDWQMVVRRDNVISITLSQV